MRYKTELSMQVIGRIKELDKNTADVIVRWLRTYIEGCEDPRQRGNALLGDKSKWRYQIGRYRLLSEIRDDAGVVLIVWIGTRDDL